VDLTSGKVDAEPLDPQLARHGLGGRGLNSLRLLDELHAATDPLSPANVLLVGVGPLTGTALPCSSRFTVSARSPQTGFLGDGNAGGHFAAELKFAGYDQLIITGASPRPVYLLIAPERAELRPAADLWGRDVWQTTDAIRGELGDPGVQVLTIGRPAELGVRFAGVITGHSRAAARTGMGAVMGSKRLKAVAVRAGGLRHAALASPSEFAALAAGIERDILAHPGFEKRKRLGTTALVSGLQALGILPTRHFQEGLFDAAGQVSGERLAETVKVKHKACFGCPVHCSRFYVLPDGTMAEGPEYETLCGFTSRIGNDDLHFALRMGASVNRHGLDSISLTEAIGWLMECAQRGLVSAGDVDGLDLTWGNRSTIAALVEKVANREGVGDLLADGALAAARRLGRGTESLVMQVKGLDMICGDPRGIKAYGLTYAIASRGADHLRAEPFFELTGDRELARQRFGSPDAADRLAWRGKASLVNYTEQIAFFTDALTMCKNIGLCMDILTPERIAALLRAALGEDVTPAHLAQIAGRVLDAERLFNLREGLDPAADTLPPRFLAEPLQRGPSSGQVVELDKMLPEYYRLRGWGSDGRPAPGRPAARRPEENRVAQGNRAPGRAIKVDPARVRPAQSSPGQGNPDGRGEGSK
jgi:aldehyde:ferredoxin oxidoreductase